MVMTTGAEPNHPNTATAPQVDVDKIVDPKVVQRTTVPIVGALVVERPEGALLPGEPGAPPIAPYDAYLPDVPKEVPFASPPPPQPGVPAGLSVLPGSKDTLPVAPGTVIPDDTEGGPGPVGNDSAVKVDAKRR